MAVLAWDQRSYESGISHGVLYPLDGAGVAWNGLRSVEESAVGGDTTDHFADGVKYLIFTEGQNYQAKVGAFAAPAEFAPHVGERSVIPGFRLTSQPKTRFNFTYCTGVGADKYKIHLVYNCLATPDTVGRTTIGENVVAVELSWIFDATPIEIAGFKATAHLVVDSRKAPGGMLADLEEILYGTALVDAAFPTLATLVGLFS